MQTIGGKWNMNTRYYIHKNQIYYRYKRRDNRKKIIALRKDDITAYKKIRKTKIICSIVLVAQIIAGICVNEYIDTKKKEVVERTLLETTSKPIVCYSTTTIHNDEIIGSENVINYEKLTYIPPKKPSSKFIGDPIIKDDAILYEMKLPSEYYNIDYSSFQPFEPYDAITNKNSPAYRFNRDERCYTDSDGFRRWKITEEQFSVDGIDDYVVALGTFYKTKDTVGERFLIVTDTGSFTIITGDEKADKDTNETNMFTIHKHGTCAGVIEYIVDLRYLNHDVKSNGTATAGPNEAMHGNILHIYKIEEGI